MALDDFQNPADGNELASPRPSFRRQNNGSNPPRVSSIIERVPPNNIEAEQAVLGSILIDNRSTAIERAMELLEPTDFYRDAHSTIFEVMIDLASKGEPIDAVTLRNELTRRGIYEAIGGVRYFLQLGEIVPSPANVNYYAKIVRDKAILRRLIEAAGEISGMAYGEVEQVDLVVDQAERSIFEVSRQRSTNNFIPMRPLITDAFAQIDKFYLEKGGLTGIETGYNDLNEMTSGFQSGDLIIIAARPSMGKTALCLNIGQNAALLANKHVAIFSLEMSKEQLVQRMLCSQAKVNAHRVRTGHLTDDDWEKLARASDELWNASLYIDDTTDISSMEMRAKCRRLKAEYGLDMIIVDYLQLVRAASKGGRQMGNRNEEITEIARSLKNLAREMSVPVVALSQLSRSVERREDKRPMLSDLRDSGSIEAEADVVGFIYRPAYYERKQAYQGENTSESAPSPADEPIMQSEYIGEEAEIIIAKQRNGPTGTVKLSFLPRYARFENLAYREDSPF